VLDQQPVGALFTLTIAHPGEDPAAVELLSLQREIELAFAIGLLRVVAIPGAAIPYHHGAAAVLTLRNGAFEVAVVQRVVLDLHRKPLVVWVQRRAFCDGPGLENPIEFEAQIVVQVRGRMLLDDETKTLCGFDFYTAAWLFGLREVSLGAVFCEQFLDHPTPHSHWN
jgi:hypothetical protein